MDKLTSMTDDAIAELERDPRVLSLRYAIEAQFDKWTQVLFPLLKLKKMSCYVYVADMLVKTGHEAATKELVGVYMRRIAKHRNVKSVVREKPVQAPQVVTPTVTLTSMAKEIQTARVARMESPTPSLAPALVVSSPPMAVPGVEPVEVIDWHAQGRRLGSEPRGTPWTGEDEFMWNFILMKAKIRNLNIFKNCPSVEEMLDIFQIDCYSLLTKKIRNK